MHVRRAAGAAGEPPSRLLTVALWVVSTATAVVLIILRLLQIAQQEAGVDLEFYLRATQSMVEGGSPYDEPGYVYSPLIAIMLSPFVAAPNIVVLWGGGSLVACLVAIAATVATAWPYLGSWQRPILALVATVTLLPDHATQLQLVLGQTDTFVLAFTAVALLLAAHHRSAWSGALLTIPALIKTWPALFFVWFLRRGARERWRWIVGAVATAGLFIAGVSITAGPSEIGRWIARTLDMSVQPLVVWSAWAVGRELFTESGHFVPIMVSPGVAIAVGLLLSAAVVAATLLALIWPGDSGLSLWHIVGATVLLLPVSHQNYHVLFLPLLWLWLALAMRSGWHPVALAGFAFNVIRWAMPFITDWMPVDSRWKYLAIMLTTVTTLVASAGLATRLPRRAGTSSPLARERDGVAH